MDSDSDIVHTEDSENKNNKRKRTSFPWTPDLEKEFGVIVRKHKGHVVTKDLNFEDKFNLILKECLEKKYPTEKKGEVKYMFPISSFQYTTTSLRNFLISKMKEVEREFGVTDETQSLNQSGKDGNVPTEAQKLFLEFATEVANRCNSKTQDKESDLLKKKTIESIAGNYLKSQGKMILSPLSHTPDSASSSAKSSSASVSAKSSSASVSSGRNSEDFILSLTTDIKEALSSSNEIDGLRNAIKEQAVSSSKDIGALMNAMKEQIDHTKETNNAIKMLAESIQNLAKR